MNDFLINLRFLGLGAAFYPALKNTNALFTLGGDLYLLDCGETAFAQLRDSPELVKASRIIAVITHLHSDHVGSLATLIAYSRFVLKKNVTVLFPHEDITCLLKIMAIERPWYTWIPAYETGENISIKAYEVEHVSTLRCYGYLFGLGDEHIYYSGDAKHVPQEIIDLFFEGKVNRIYQDVAIEERNHLTHGSFHELETIFPPETRSRVYCIHLDTDFRPLIKEKGFSLPPLV
ncbi:MAG: MBL fold metallo-hydrolase [Treponema sp.]|jgi:ribonuclease BN (tRNA processing enzyme)|nr:MBL fold metallo-hydrolase [Treponema sp.]